MFQNPFPQVTKELKNEPGIRQFLSLPQAGSGPGNP
jgi:hypothetical protein